MVVCAGVGAGVFVAVGAGMFVAVGVGGRKALGAYAHPARTSQNAIPNNRTFIVPLYGVNARYIF